MLSNSLKKFNKPLMKNIKIAQKALIYAQPENDIPGENSRVFEEAIAYLLRVPELFFRADIKNKIILIGDASIPVSDDSDHVYISCAINQIIPLHRLDMSNFFRKFDNNSLQDSLELSKIYSKDLREDKGQSKKREHLIAGWKSSLYARKTLYRRTTNQNYKNPSLGTLRRQTTNASKNKANSLCKAFFPTHVGNPPEK